MRALVYVCVRVYGCMRDAPVEYHTRNVQYIIYILYRTLADFSIKPLSLSLPLYLSICE